MSESRRAWLCASGLVREALLEHLEQQLALVVRDQRCGAAGGPRRRTGSRPPSRTRAAPWPGRPRRAWRRACAARTAPRSRRPRPRRRPAAAAHDEEQRAVRALGLVELARGARHLGELLLDRRVRDVHLRRRLHLGHRLVELALGLRDARELDVQRGALGRAAAAEVGDQLGQRGARLGELAGDALADRERGAQILVGRIERERGLERGDRLRRRAELASGRSSTPRARTRGRASRP